jgi:hypothetical protein
MTMLQRKADRSTARHVHATLAALLAAVGAAIVLALVALPGESPASPAAKPHHSTGIAAKATSAAPAMPRSTAAPSDFDYFPDHYVNQATKIEAPIENFYGP